MKNLDAARLVVGHRHEERDGSGYTDGLAGEAIPLPRIVGALADLLPELDTAPPGRSTAGAVREHE